MATATIKATNIEILDDANDATQWNADRSLSGPDTELFLESTGSMGCTIQAQPNANEIWITKSTGTWDLTDTHIRLWVFFTAVGQLYSSNNDGFRIGVSDASNTGWWTVGGSDTYGGGWKLLQVDTRLPVDAGTKPTMSAITDVRLEVNLITSPKNAQNLWTDYWHHTNLGYEVYGGTAGDPITWSDIAASDATSAIGIVQEIDGVYFLSGPVQIGAGSRTTYFEWTTETVVFVDNIVNENFYKIKGFGSNTDISITGGSVLSIADPFDFDMSDSSLGSCSVQGLSIQRADDCIFKSGQSIDSVKFILCDSVSGGGSTFSDNTFTQSSSAASGAYYWNSNDDISDCSFTNNTGENFPLEPRPVSGYGIYHAASGSFDYQDLKFSNNDADIYFGGRGTLTINALGTSNPTTYVVDYADASVNIVAAYSYTLTGIISGSEVQFVEQAGEASIFHVENTTTDDGTGETTQVTYNYNYTDDIPIYIYVHNIDYKWLRISDTLTNTNKTVPASQEPDPWYSNP